VALIAPTVLAAAPQTVAVGSRSSAIAAVSTMGYLGSFTGPAIIGALASRSGLPAALSVLTAAATLTALLSRRALTRPEALTRAADDTS
jgi:hypothetical protein